MIPYILSQLGRVLRETLVPAVAPRHVSTNCTRYVVHLNGTTHHLRRDRACSCGGTPQAPCPAVPLVRGYLVAGGPRPPGHPESTWPQAWTAVPPTCPICDCPAVADHHLDSSRGPGWRCTLDAGHYWQVRLNSLRRALAAYHETPRYPWYSTPETERQAWLEAHSHPPRCVTNSNPLEVMP